jgi:hypothetical protein
MHPAVMRKVHIYLPQEHIKIIKEIAKHEGITFAEMTRRCLHLGLRAIVEDHAAFLKVNWLRVLDTAKRSQVDQRIRQQFHAIVPLLDAFKTEQ